MTPEQRFLSKGADYFGMRLIYRNQDVGILTKEGLSLLIPGEKLLAEWLVVERTGGNSQPVTDVEAKPVERKRVKVIPKASAPSEPLTPVLGAALDDMMADIK